MARWRGRLTFHIQDPSLSRGYGSAIVNRLPEGRIKSHASPAAGCPWIIVDINPRFPAGCAPRQRAAASGGAASGSRDNQVRTDAPGQESARNIRVPRNIRGHIGHQIFRITRMFRVNPAAGRPAVLLVLM